MRTTVNKFGGVSVDFDTDTCMFSSKHSGVRHSFDDYKTAEFYAREKADEDYLASVFGGLDERDKESLLRLAYNDGYVFVCNGNDCNPGTFESLAKKSMLFIAFNLSIAYRKHNLHRINDKITIDEMVDFFLKK